MPTATNISTFGELLNNNEFGTVHNYCVNGKCSGCGACCSNTLPISDDEVLRIKRYMKLHHITEQTRHFNVLANPVAIDLTCPFMKNDKTCEKCTIYEVRPAICRKFICNDPPKIGDIEESINWYQKHPLRDVRKTFFG